jgi:hypothetical protein
MAGGDATGSTPAPASCSPPFVVENGIRRIKRECVR